MLKQLIAFSLKQSSLVLLAGALLLAWAGWRLPKMP